MVSAYGAWSVPPDLTHSSRMCRSLAAATSGWPCRKCLRPTVVREIVTREEGEGVENGGREAGREEWRKAGREAGRETGREAGREVGREGGPWRRRAGHTVRYDVM